MTNCHSNAFFKLSSCVFRKVVLCITIVAVGFTLLLASAIKGLAAENCLPENTYRGMTVEECNALMQIYNATDGPNWRYSYGAVPWGEQGPKCNTFPYAVICSDGVPGERHVISLQLANCGLNGMLPESAFARLPHLIEIWMQNNSLTGYIPVEISNLSYLKKLYLNNNKLNGQIPEGLIGDKDSPYNNLSSSVQLHLEDNNLSGELPESLGRDDVPEFLVHNNVNLNGPIPHTYIPMKAMTSFRYSNTQVCEPQDQEMQDWLNNFSSLYRTNIACEESLLAPSFITASRGTSRVEITVTWGISVGLVYYELQRRISSSTSWSHLAYPNSEKHSDMGAIIGQKYHYRVRACTIDEQCSPFVETTTSGYIGNLASSWFPMLEILLLGPSSLK